MATAKNKLPTFGASAEIDNSIVADTSGLKTTGFQYNTTIKSAEMNTYMKMLINGMSGLIDAVYDSGVSQAEINATSSADEIKNYVKLGLNNIIKSTTVNTAVHANEATNVDAITNNDTAANANVEFSIGDQSFSKTVNNVAHATNAEKLETARTIQLGDQLAGTATFDGTDDITIDATFTNKGQDGEPIYINSNGKITEVSYINQNILIAPDSRQHTKLSAGSLSNRWKNDPTTDNSNIFIADGAEEMMDLLGNRTNVGSTAQPVYFSNGKPVACNLLDSIYPVGSIYMSTNDNSPQNFLGGTWERIQGRFLLGAGSGYNAGSTGGEATHTLTTDEMPQHNHTLRVASSIQGTSSQYMAVVSNNPVIRTQVSSIANFSADDGAVSNIRNVDAGKSVAHNNMPPYLAVYIWKRTA